MMVFDDGEHLYLEFLKYSGTDVPALMSQQGQQPNTVNYSVRDSLRG